MKIEDCTFTIEDGQKWVATEEIKRKPLFTAEDIRNHFNEIADKIREFAFGITVVPNNTRSICISAEISPVEVTELCVEFVAFADPRLRRKDGNDEA